MTLLRRLPASAFAAPLFALAGVGLHAPSVHAAVDLAQCQRIPDRERRLDCFDRLAAEAAAPGSAPSAASPTPTVVAPGMTPTAPAGSSPPAGQPSPRFSLSERWELAAADKQGVFRFRPYRDNYVLIANYATSPNGAPHAQSTASEHGPLSHTEVAYQLSFKMKLVQNVFRQPLDVWFGYTQNSFWQAYNRDASRPFRETNYQPEVVAVAPLDLSAGGLRLRFVGVGLVHQSNGQVSTRSRSWNRVYAQLGAEMGDLSLFGRVWTRVGDVDDNPDIYRYLGHGELAGVYRWRGHEFSALLRGVGSGRGGVQAGWAFPLFQNLKGYAQVYSGYGASLIDYNSYQHTYGLGVLIDF